MMKSIKTLAAPQCLDGFAYLAFYGSLPLIFAAGCCKTPQSTATNHQAESIQTDCGQLDQVLLPLATHADPMAYGKQHDLLTQTSDVRVIVTVDDGHTPQWPTTMTVELQIDSRFQLLVRPTDLCALGQHQGVSSVSLPRPSSPKDTDPTE